MILSEFGDTVPNVLSIQKAGMAGVYAPHFFWNYLPKFKARGNHLVCNVYVETLDSTANLFQNHVQS